jgi:hypothetical protein
MKDIVFTADHLLTAMGAFRLRPESIFTDTGRINVFIAAPPLSAWAVNIAPPASTKNRFPKSRKGVVQAQVKLPCPDIVPCP